MNDPTEPDRLRSLLASDKALLDHLRSADFLPHHDGDWTAMHLELARVAHTLVHELGVNEAGVEIILRMRNDVIDLRRQTTALLLWMRDRQGDG